MSSNDTHAGAPSPLHLARRALRHLPLFLAVLAGGFVITAVAVGRTDQIYRSEAVILYRQPPRQGYGDGDSARRAGSRLQDMLLARERLRRTADELRLFPELPDRNAAVDELRKRVGFQARDGSTFLVWYDAASPKVAQAATRRLSETLIDDNTRLRTREAANLRELLAEERRQLERAVAAKESILAQFFQKNPGIGARAGGGGATDDTGEAAALQAELERLRAQAGLPRESAALDPALLAQQQRAEQDLAAAQRELADKSDRYTDQHPDVAGARERARRAEEALRRVREAQQAARAQADAEATRRDVPDELRGQIAQLERQLASLRRASSRARGPRVSPHVLKLEVQLESLRHDLEQTRQRLASLDEKQFQATLNARLETSGEVGQLSILDPASRPGLPTVDKRKKVLLGGVAGSVLLALVIAFLRARTDDRIHDRDDAQWLGNTAVLVSIPARRPERRRKVAHHG